MKVAGLARDLKMHRTCHLFSMGQVAFTAGYAPLVPVLKAGRLEVTVRTSIQGMGRLMVSLFLYQWGHEPAHLLGPGRSPAMTEEAKAVDFILSLRVLRVGQPMTAHTCFILQVERREFRLLIVASPALLISGFVQVESILYCLEKGFIMGPVAAHAVTIFNRI